MPPHSHACPFGTTCMWPNSPAIPLKPRCTVPSSTTAPPMPVPRVTTSAYWEWPTAPNAISARAAQFASLSRTTGAFHRSASRARTPSSRQGRCGANRTRSPWTSTNPAAAIPIADGRRVSESSSTASVSASSMRLASTWRPGVVRVAVRNTRPVEDTAAARTLVPPMSTPMKSATVPLPSRQVGGADQPGAVPEPCLADLRDGPEPAAHELTRERRPRGVEQQLVGLADAATDHDDARVEDLGQRRDALAEPAAELGQLLPGALVAVLGRLGDQRAGDLLQVAARAAQHALGDLRTAHRERPRLPHQCGAAGVLLEAAVLAAAAEDAVRYDAHVADLRADAVRAAVDLTVQHQPAADTGADGDQQQVLGVVAGAVHELAPRRGVGVVLDHDRELDALLELALEVLVAPGDVRCEEHHRALLVDVAGRTHADRLDRVPGAELGHQAGDRLLDGLGVGRGRLDAELLDDRAVLVDDTAGDLGAADVDPTGQAHRSPSPGSWGSVSSGQSAESSSRSMFWTREARSPGTGVAISPAAAWISADAAVASWVRTSGLAWRSTCTVLQIGQ